MIGPFHSSSSGRNDTPVAVLAAFNTRVSGEECNPWPRGAA